MDKHRATAAQLLLPSALLNSASHVLQAAPVFWEGSKLQAIVWAVSEDLGGSWTAAQQLVAPVHSLPIWAPVLHVQVYHTWAFYLLYLRIFQEV